MIRLDLDLNYLTRCYNLQPEKLKMISGNHSIVDIMEEEAANGNTKAADFEFYISNNPDKLIELFNLEDPVNRYKLLAVFNFDDLYCFLSKMEPADLAIGLKFFSKEKVLMLLKTLPPERIMELLKQVFSVSEIVKLLPEKYIDKFFLSEKLSDKVILKYLTLMPSYILAKLFENVTGMPCKEKSKKQLLKGIQAMDPEELRMGILCLNNMYKNHLLTVMLKDDESLFKFIEPEALVKPLEKFQKDYIIHIVGEVLKPEEIIKLIDSIPTDLLAMLGTQLDINVFSDVLLSKFPYLISEISLN